MNCGCGYLHPTAADVYADGVLTSFCLSGAAASAVAPVALLLGCDFVQCAAGAVAAAAVSLSLCLSYVMKKPEYAPPAHPAPSADPLQLLDYRCHAPGGAVGTNYPKQASVLIQLRL